MNTQEPTITHDIDSFVVTAESVAHKHFGCSGCERVPAVGEEWAWESFKATPGYFGAAGVRSDDFWCPGCRSSVVADVEAARVDLAGAEQAVMEGRRLPEGASLWVRIRARSDDGLIVLEDDDDDAFMVLVVRNGRNAEALRA